MQVFMVIESGIDYDVLWHIKQGEVYMTHGVTTQDYLSWQSSLSWTTAEWLYEIFIYWVTRLTGTIGFIVLLGLSTYQLYGWQMVKNGLKHPFIYFIIFGITFLFPKNIYNRPGEFQIIVATVIVYWAIYNRDKLWLKSLCAGVFLANFHGGQVVTLLATLAIIDFVYFVHYILVEDEVHKKLDIKAIKSIQIQIALMFIQSLLNPMGISMYTVGMKVPSMYSTQFITEWQPWNIDYASGVLILLQIIAITFQKKFRSLDVQTLSIVAIIQAYTILSIKTQRLAGYLQAFIILFAYPYIIEFYEDMVDRVKRQRIKQIELKLSKEKPDDVKEDEWKVYRESLLYRLDKLNGKVETNKDSEDNQSKQKAAKINVIYSVICIGLLMFNAQYIMTSVNGQYTLDSLVQNKQDFQTEIVEYIKENDIQQGIFNGYTTGGWMIWNDIKQFIDSRQQPYTVEIQNNEQLDDTLHAIKGHNAVEEIQNLCDKYDIDYIWWSVQEFGYDIKDELLSTGEWEVAIEATDTELPEYMFIRA